MTETPSRYLHTGRKKVDRVCQECGAVVADTDIHDEWHDTYLRLVKGTAKLAAETFAQGELTAIGIQTLADAINTLGWETPT